MRVVDDMNSLRCSKVTFPTSATYYNCPRCGEYAITSIARKQIKDPSYNEKKNRISHLLCENRLKKGKLVLLHKMETEKKNERFGAFTCVELSDYLEAYPQEAAEFIDRILLNLSRMVSRPSEEIKIQGNYSIPSAFFLNNTYELKYYFKQLYDIGYTSDGIDGSIRITLKGWNRINELKTKTPGDTKQVFVAMWFDKSMDNIFADAIKPAIESINNYKAFRIDTLEHNNKICDEIIAEIKKSRFVIADFTGQRGGVYYEAGFAQGLGLPVIWIVEENDVQHLHFDTRQYNHIVYKDAADLKAKLKARIEATIL
jgi:predicted RNA-binding Zn-ribbon protein involved in translation (DUF1610 family)